MTGAERDWFDILLGVTSALNTVVLLALVLVLAPSVIAMTKNLRQLRALLDRAYDELRPFTDHANRIAANVDEISETVRDEVRQVKETVGQATQGIHDAVESTERRLRDFGALMDVAQSEAEHVVARAASTARGVRAGVAALRDDDSEDLLGDEPPKPRKAHPKVRSRRKRAG